MPYRRVFALFFIAVAVTLVFTGVQYIGSINGNITDVTAEPEQYSGQKTGSGDTDPMDNLNNQSEISRNPSQYIIDKRSQQYPTEKRYVSGVSTDWIPESELSIQKDVPGTYEVTRYPNAKPAKRDLEKAWRLYNQSFEAAEEEEWFTYSKGIKDGYNISVGPKYHHYNAKYLLNGEDLNPHKPESIIYYEDPREEEKMILAGYMYLTLKPEGEQVAGPLTVWHYHPMTQSSKRLQEKVISESRFESLEEFLRQTNTSLRKTINEKPRSTEMIHVWFIKHPEGPFGSSMWVPKNRLKEPEKMSEKEFKEHLLKKYNEDFKSK